MNETLDLANEFAKELLVQLPGYEAKVVDLTNERAQWVEVNIYHYHYPSLTVRFVDKKLHSISTTFGLVYANVLKVISNYV